VPDRRESLRVLHVEDDPVDRELVAETLRSQGLMCDIVAVDTRDAFADALDSGGLDVILADDRLPTFNGQAALALAVERAPDVPFIFVSGTLGEEIAVERLKAGATDYVVKQRLARLGSAINRALGEAQVRREHARAQEAKLFLEDLIAASPSMIFRIDPREFRITYASPNVDRLLGYNQREIVGVRNFWRTLLHQDDLERAAGHLREALESHTVQIPQEYRFRSADGRYRWFFSLMHVEYSDTGGPMRILWYCIDISDRRTAEQALLESEERTRAILRTANDAFVGADTGGRIVEWNTRAEAMFGWPREEALGRILADTIVPESYREQHRRERELDRGRETLLDLRRDAPPRGDAHAEVALDRRLEVGPVLLVDGHVQVKLAGDAILELRIADAHRGDVQWAPRDQVEDHEHGHRDHEEEPDGPEDASDQIRNQLRPPRPAIS